MTPSTKPTRARTGRALLSLGLALTAFGGVAAGQQADEVAELKRKVAAQDRLIQQLMERLDALESDRTGGQKPPPAGKAETEDRLEAVQADLDAATAALERLPSLGGYLDFEYMNDDRSKSPGAFRQHHLTLLLSKELEAFRVFGEVEFEYGTLFEGDGAKTTTSRGELKLEQAWGEYSFADQLTLRGGLLLTPGHWNVNHWPNLVLSTRRPLMVREIYPESFTGLMAYGSRFRNELGADYSVYAGNGVSGNSAKQDDNEDKAAGARVSFHLPTKRSFDTFDVGLSGYTDKPVGARRTNTWGLDAQIRRGPFELLSEFATRAAAEDRTGFYLQPSYRLNDRWTAFYRYDLLDVKGGDKAREHTLGLNVRPLSDVPEIQLKLELFRSLHSQGEDYNGLASSFAVGF